MRACNRCRNRHIGSLIANTGWMVLFLCDFEDSCQEWELQAQSENHVPIGGWKTTDRQRFIALANS